MSIIKLNKPITMSSLQIAEITGLETNIISDDEIDVIEFINNPFYIVNYLGEYAIYDNRIPPLHKEQLPLEVSDNLQDCLNWVKNNHFYNAKELLALHKFNKTHKTIYTYYVLFEDNIAKIGRTTNTNQRIPCIERQRGVRIKNILICNKDVELELHKLFDNDRLKGECFNHSEDKYAKLFEMGFSNHLINEMLRKKQKLLN